MITSGKVFDITDFINILSSSQKMYGDRQNPYQLDLFEEPFTYSTTTCIPKRITSYKELLMQSNHKYHEFHEKRRELLEHAHSKLLVMHSDLCNKIQELRFVKNHDAELLLTLKMEKSAINQRIRRIVKEKKNCVIHFSSGTYYPPLGLEHVVKNLIREELYEHHR